MCEHIRKTYRPFSGRSTYNGRNGGPCGLANGGPISMSVRANVRPHTFAPPATATTKYMASERCGNSGKRPAESIGGVESACSSAAAYSTNPPTFVATSCRRTNVNGDDDMIDDVDVEDIEVDDAVDTVDTIDDGPSTNVPSPRNIFWLSAFCNNPANVALFSIRLALSSVANTNQINVECFTKINKIKTLECDNMFTKQATDLELEQETRT